MDETNGKLTSIELEIALDNVKSELKSLIEIQKTQSLVAKHKFDSLIEVGFTEDQALKICSTAFIF